MEAPQCKICRERHFGLCKTRQVATTTLAAVVKAAKAPPRVAPAAELAAELEIAPETVAAWRAMIEGRQAYMREYMKKYRAKNREEK